jgi:hypothetical protein
MSSITIIMRPLQKSYNNTYTPPEKIEINESDTIADFENGMLSFNQMYLIIDNGLCSVQFTVA